MVYLFCRSTYTLADGLSLNEHLHFLHSFVMLEIIWRPVRHYLFLSEVLVEVIARRSLSIPMTQNSEHAFTCIHCIHSTEQTQSFPCTL